MTLMDITRVAKEGGSLRIILYIYIYIYSIYLFIIYIYFSIWVCSRKRATEKHSKVAAEQKQTGNRLWFVSSQIISWSFFTHNALNITKKH